MLCNGRADKEAFDGKLEFDVKLIPYTGNYEWVEPTVNTLHACLNAEAISEAEKDCDYCRYRVEARELDSS